MVRAPQVIRQLAGFTQISVRPRRPTFSVEKTVSSSQTPIVGNALKNWTPEQIAAGKKWVAAWGTAGPELERIRREELRDMDVHKAIAALCADYDYTLPPRAPKPTSGLVEQQRWFMKLAHRE
jgi:hypothetical protein